ncbi:MAG: hypothetical protein WBM46_12485 [Polyangiales bacterium]
MKHALHQLDFAVGALDVYRGTAQTHRHPELRFEGTQVRATRARELEQKAGIGDFDVGGYIGLDRAALRSLFDAESLACPSTGGE